MGARYDIDELVGAAEIAGRLGCSNTIVYEWQRRHEDFPKPVAQLTMGKLWHWPEVEAWARRTGRVH